jgi:hypothetical protein
MLDGAVGLFDCPIGDELGTRASRGAITAVKLS